MVTIFTLYPIAIAVFVFWCSLWLLHLIAIFYGRYRLHRRIERLTSDDTSPGVSILKPLRGVDSNLCSNLETFFLMDYRSYELLFCIEDEADPALEIAKKLTKKYPEVPATIFLGGSNIGINPKINNINKAYEAAKYDLILISDSGIRMREDTLQDMVNRLTEEVGIVHQLPFTNDRQGFSATLEKIYFGTAHSRMYLGADLFNINCHTGMSTLMRKTVLEQDGGLKKFGCYLAEDFFIAQYFQGKGWKTKISGLPALQNSGICNVSNFRARMTRWAKLRFAMVPTVTVVEPLTECMIIGAYAAWSVNILFQWDYLPFYFVHVLLWFLCDWTLLCIIQNGPLPFSRYEFIMAWLVREFLGPYVVLAALINPVIKWGNREYKLSWGGVAEEIKPRIKC